VLSAAWRYIIKKGNERVASISEVAAGLGLSVPEIRDEARTWTDTSVKYNRIYEALRARLFTFMLAEEKDECQPVRRAAAKMIKMDLEERQLEVDSTKMGHVGGDVIINIVNYARPGKAKRFGEKKKAESSPTKDLQPPAPSGKKKSRKKKASK
jgi:hypothetical protein